MKTFILLLLAAVSYQQKLKFIWAPVLTYSSNDLIDSSSDLGQEIESRNRILGPYNNYPIINRPNPLQPMPAVAPPNIFFSDQTNGVDSVNIDSFFNRPLFNPLNFLLKPFQYSYRPGGGIVGQRTITVAVTSTILTASVTTCIPASLFSGGTLATTCGNRKRRDAQVIDLLEEAIKSDGFIIYPTPTEMLMPTAMVNARTAAADYEPRIISSISTQSDDELAEYRRPQFRAFLRTQTLTTTYFYFNSTQIKKTITPAAANGLVCIPSGFTFC